MNIVLKMSFCIVSMAALLVVRTYAVESTGTPGDKENKAVVKSSQSTTVWNAKMIDDGIAYENGKLQKNPRDIDAYNSRAVLYARKKEFDKALADYAKALEISPDNTMIYNNRGLLYEKMGSLDKAIADFSKIIKLDPSGDRAYWAYIYRARVYSAMHEDDKAREDLQKAKELMNTFVQ